MYVGLIGTHQHFSDGTIGTKAHKVYVAVGIVRESESFQGTHIHCVPKKEATKLWAVTLSNLNRF